MARAQPPAHRLLSFDWASMTTPGQRHAIWGTCKNRFPVFVISFVYLSVLRGLCF